MGCSRSFHPDRERRGVSARKTAGTPGPKALDEVSALLRLPGMDPKRLRTLAVRVSVRSREDLRRALAAGRLAGMEGFGREVKSRLQAALAADADSRQGRSSRGLGLRDSCAIPGAPCAAKPAARA